jgi:phospholipid/cholesterol/gamma-HCH transport system substrate-binding protein
MENKVSYIVIGIFVFALFGFGIGAILWLGKYSESQTYKFYKVITKESVSGLNVKAPVKLKGVSVGEVREIFIDPKNSEDVVVLIRVVENTPIKKDTYAVLKPQGITGLNFVELQGSSQDMPPLKTGDSMQTYGIIHSHSSIFTRLDNTLEVIGTRTQKVLGKADKVMSEKNIKNLEIILQNLALSTQKLNTTLDGIAKDTENIKSVLQKASEVEDAMAEASKKVALMSGYISDAVNQTAIPMMQGVKTASNKVQKVMQDLEKKMKKGTFDIDILLKESMIPLESTLQEFRLLAIDMRNALQKLSDSPSDILYKQGEMKPAPNEEGR